MTDPFADIIAALHAETTADNRVVRVDPNRESRTGAPEIVYASSKAPEHLLEAMHALVKTTGRAIASRVTDTQAEFLRASVPDQLRLTLHTDARIAILRSPDHPSPSGAGTIGVITAGTSDVPMAREATIIAEEMGCEVIEAHDAGVAGLHRLVAPLRQMVAREADAIIVAAGMDGALPSVVAGLVDVPVIGLPTSVGYGAGGTGEAALRTMLQSCAPGLVVVNIDNGIGAGVTAALIARRKSR
ncbi:MAG TPA: nickel pincer cofactor biosynthesis protein LarB [Thermomicrobiales bacterium]|nr:nickel pincer cofactor biosynthesis protein LarB [Thermomicrobiales bacterium]